MTAAADTSEHPAPAADGDATDVADVDNEPPQGAVDENDGRTPVLPPTSSRQPTETVVTSEAARGRIQEMIAAYRANVVLPEGRRKRRLQALEAAQKAAEANGEDLAAKRFGRRPGPTRPRRGTRGLISAASVALVIRATALSCAGTKCNNVISGLCVRQMCGRCCRGAAQKAPDAPACVLHPPLGTKPKPADATFAAPAAAVPM